MCTGGRSCVTGSCACPGGQTFCSNQCVTTSNNNAHCGACGTTCTGGRSCVGTACLCPSGQTFCSGQCVTTSSNPSHCGGCGTVCASGMCNGGTCAPRNLIVNGDFATSVTGWSVGGEGSHVFSTADGSGSPASGSLELQANAVMNAIADQCVALEANTDYLLTAQQFTPFSAYTEPAAIHLTFFFEPGCSVPAAAPQEVSDAGFDEWRSMSLYFNRTGAVHASFAGPTAHRIRSRSVSHALRQRRALQAVSRP